MSVQHPEDIHRAVTAAFNAGDSETLLTLYEPDASLAPSPGQVITGTEAVREALGGFLAPKGHMIIETRRIVAGVTSRNGENRTLTLR